MISLDVSGRILPDHAKGCLHLGSKVLQENEDVRDGHRAKHFAYAFLVTLNILDVAGGKNLRIAQVRQTG